MSYTCEICGNADGNRTHLVREMMFGWRDEFTYLECGRCGCLQNVSVPADLGRYYGDGYYSVTPAGTRPRPVFDAMKKLRTRAFIEGKGMLGRLLLASFGEPSLPDYVNRWIRRAGVRQSSRLLEIGCGTGFNLLAMRSEGFTSLSGADPFIERDIDYGAACGSGRPAPAN